MRSLLTSSLALALTLLASPAGAAPKHSNHRCSSAFAITNVRVFDGDKMIPKATVIVVDDEITAVGPKVAVPPGTPTIDGTGSTLLPGLLDSHAHAWQREELERAAQFGVTTEFDMWSELAFIQAMTEEQELDGATDRADVFSAISPATVTEGYPYNWTPDIIESPTVDSPAAAKKFVKDRLKDGANHLKIMLEDGTLTGPAIPVLSNATIVALTTEASKRGMLSMAHVTRQETALAAVSSGVDGLVHVFVDALASDDFVELAVSRGIFVVGTLAAEESFITTAGGEAIIDDPDLGPYLTELEKEYLLWPPLPSVLTLENLQIAKDNVLALHDAGVPILAGTDVSTHGISIHRDLELLVDAGLDPIDALVAATSAPAD
ncbi:MAG TPA: amidohydrolase family protein, partial [Nannocystis sp.]